jgi:Bacterial membrane protein YfhO
VRFLIGPVSLDSPAIERVVPREPSPFFVYRMREPLPLAYLATRLLRAPSERDAFNRLIAPDFQLGRDAVVSELPPDWIDAAAARSDPGEVEIVSYESDAVRLRAESKRRALLVLSDSDFPGWEATVDGRSVAIVRTNALVRGVALDAGSHLVEFRYRPASLRRGATISAVSLVTLAVIVVFLALRRPTQPTVEMGPSSQSFEARRA